MTVGQLAPHTHGREVLAKRGGRCKGCPEPIRRGEDYIVVVDRLGAMHAQCGIAYCRTLNEHLEDEPA
jgi:hypothetical protein